MNNKKRPAPGGTDLILVIERFSYILIPYIIFKGNHMGRRLDPILADKLIILRKSAEKEITNGQ